MIKKDILKEMVERVNDKYIAEEIEKKVTQKDVDFMITAFEEMIRETIAGNIEEKIPFGGLGTFRGKAVPAKDGVLAATGKPWHTDAHNEILFKVSKTAKAL